MIKTTITIISILSFLVIASLLITVRQSIKLRKIVDNLKQEINEAEDQRLLLAHEFQIQTRLDYLQDITRELSANGQPDLAFSPPTRNKIFSLQGFRDYIRKIENAPRVYFKSTEHQQPYEKVIVNEKYKYNELLLNYSVYRINERKNAE